MRRRALRAFCALVFSVILVLAGWSYGVEHPGVSDVIIDNLYYKELRFAIGSIDRNVKVYGTVGRYRSVTIKNLPLGKYCLVWQSPKQPPDYVFFWLTASNTGKPYTITIVTKGKIWEVKMETGKVDRPLVVQFVGDTRGH